MLFCDISITLQLKKPRTVKNKEKVGDWNEILGRERRGASQGC